MHRYTRTIRAGFFFVSAMFFAAGCGGKQETSPARDAQSTDAKPDPSTMSPPARQDVTTATLVTIDPEIQSFADAVTAAKASFEKTKSPASKSALIEAYLKFGDYMQYESPVSPRKGKYRRALMEYRHALKLDPASGKAQREIQQIEEIYRSMNRPVPSEDEV